MHIVEGSRTRAVRDEGTGRCVMGIMGSSSASSRQWRAAGILHGGESIVMNVLNGRGKRAVGVPIRSAMRCGAGKRMCCFMFVATTASMFRYHWVAPSSMPLSVDSG